MIVKEKTEQKIFHRIRHDFEFRTFVTSAFSFIATIAFMSYNIFLGIRFKTSWNIGISIYYALLVCIRAVVLFFETLFQRRGLSKEMKEQKRKKIFLAQSVMLLIVDVALIAPIAMMVLQKRDVQYTEITAIAFAAYTVYKMIMSAKNIVKSNTKFNLGVKAFRTLNFVEALVSVLTLQYTLVMTFNSQKEDDMFLLCAITSFAIWLFLIVVSVKMLYSAIKL